MPAFSGLEEKTVKITDHAWLESVKGLLAVCVAEGHVYLLSAEELMVVRTIAQPFGATASAVAVGSGDIMVPHCLRSFSQGFLIGGADGYVAVWELGDDDAYVSADKEGGDDGKGSGTPPESLYKFTSSVRVRQSDAAVCSLDLTNGEENLLLGFRDSNMGVISFGSLYAPADEQVTCNVIYGGNHCGPITGLDIAVQRPLAASICFKDGTLRVWNYATRVCELQADFPGEDPVAVALHPFGYFVAVAFAEKLRFLHILVRDLKPFKEFSVRGVKLIRFANGGHMLAASQGKLIHIFSSRTLDKVVTLQGHTQQVVGLCFDPEDHFLWSYGQDGRFIEWATQDWTQANSHTNEGAAFLSMASNGVGSVTCSILRGNRCFVQTFKQSVLEEEHEIAGGHRLTTVCQFPGSDAIFAGTENGNLRVYPNLQASGNLEFSEVGLHTGGACSCLCLSTDGRMLITAGEDGAVFVLSVSGIVAGEEAMSMALAANGGDSENARTPEAEAVLATRAEIQRLQSLCQALLAEHGLLRTRIVAEASKLEEECTAKVAEARQKDQAEIQELIRRITALEQASDAKERESQRIMKSMESSHGEAAEQLEHLYERKISHESDRMVVLQLHREKFEAQIQMEFEQLQERLDDSEARAKTELERVLAEGDLDLKKHQDLLAFVQHRFEVLLERGADEHDLEVTRLRQGGREALDQQKSVEGKLRKEQEALLRGLEMMEKDREHIEKEQQESVTTLKSLREQSEELKRTLASLKDERRDRDSTLRDKEIRIQSYEVKVKTLKKFKHVLDQRLAKVTEELQPKDHLIEQLHQDSSSDVEVPAICFLDHQLSGSLVDGPLDQAASLLCLCRAVDVIARLYSYVSRAPIQATSKLLTSRSLLWMSVSLDCFGLSVTELSVNDPRFVDTAFPPSASSLGVPKPGRHFISDEQRASARWIRLPNLLHMSESITYSELKAVGSNSRIVWEGLSAADLAQGSVGNCWLVASIAALAERSSDVRKLFLESDPAAGRYVVQLYDMGKACWERVEIDDFVPCTQEDDWSKIPFREDADGKRVYIYQDVYDAAGQKKVPRKWVPLFGKPNGRQVWALLLEKAMAKFVGSYALLAGGSEPYAFMALTGFPVVYVFQRPAVDEAETAAVLGRWEWRGALFAGRSATGAPCERLAAVPDDLLDDELWPKVMEYSGRGCLMTASITRYAQPQSILDYHRPDGLISGHAYAVLTAREVELHVATEDRESQAHFMPVAKGAPQSLRLVSVRNPHGDWKASGGTWSSTWTGDWGSESACWQRHPEVAAQLGSDVSASLSESAFWMPWDDFKQAFDKLCVVAKSRSHESEAGSDSPRTLAENPGSPGTHGPLDGGNASFGNGSKLIEENGAGGLHSPRYTQEGGLVPGGRSSSLELCPSLARMASSDSPDSPSLRQDLRQLSITFDPFLALPEFLDDGSLDTRLQWEASKPGHLQRLLDTNKANEASYAMLMQRVSALGLDAALGENGSYHSGKCHWVPTLPRPQGENAGQGKEGIPPWKSLIAFPPSDGAAAEGCIVSAPAMPRMVASVTENHFCGSCLFVGWVSWFALCCQQLVAGSLLLYHMVRQFMASFDRLGMHATPQQEIRYAMSWVSG
ncbi:unnamed protein product [Polarella glacialis]|uniref:Calpain catalytic domain-containing protein n=1 Tax=Polarella glacialis TaxID=89957 RepID=A0A813HD63_POLGL|nr:unnamed protein product [Polarella glacialis]